MSKVTLLLVLTGLIFLKQPCLSQSLTTKSEFEGVIRYKIEILDKMPIAGRASLQKEWGDTLVFYYRNGNYRMRFNGSKLSDIYYVANQNIEYTLIRKADSIFAGDCSRLLDSLYEISHDTKLTNVAGFQCQKITVHSNHFIRTFWYDSTYHINADHYRNFNTGLLNAYYETSFSLFLRQELVNPYFTVIYQVISLEPRKITDEELTLPAYPITRNIEILTN